MHNKFFKNYINLKDKNLKWYNLNFYYVATITMIVAMIIGYFTIKPYAPNSFWNIYVVSFTHVNAVHITFNVIMLVLLSLLLERHFGSFTYLIMLIFIIPLANLSCFATKSFLYTYDTKWSGAGESCVNYFLFGLVLVLVAFNYREYILSKNAFIFFIPLVFFIFLSSINSNNISTPSDFFTHPSMRFMDVFYTNTAGHFAPFIVGIIIGILIFTILSTTKISDKKNRSNNGS